MDWSADTVAPSRLGEETAEVLLGRWEGERLLQWRNDKPAKHAWAYSTLRVARRLIAEAAPRWRAKTNHWRAITSLNPMFRVTHRRPRVRTRGQTNVDWQNRTMTRYDVLVWLSLAGVFTAYCVTMWTCFPLGD